MSLQTITKKQNSAKCWDYNDFISMRGNELFKYAPKKEQKNKRETQIKQLMKRRVVDKSTTAWFSASPKKLRDTNQTPQTVT